MKRSNRTASLNALFAFQSVQPKQIYSHIDWDSYMGFQEPTEKRRRTMSNIGCRGELIMLINKLTPKRLKGSRFRKQNGELWAINSTSTQPSDWHHANTQKLLHEMATTWLTFFAFCSTKTKNNKTNTKPWPKITKQKQNHGGDGLDETRVVFLFFVLFV